MKTFLASLICLFALSTSAHAQLGNVGVGISVGTPGGNVVVGYSTYPTYYNNGYYNPYNNGYYNQGYNTGCYNQGYYNPGYYNQGYYNQGYYNRGGCYNTGTTIVVPYATYPRYPYTPVVGGRGRGRCR